MTCRSILATLVLSLAPAVSAAEPVLKSDVHGTLNPQELSLEGALDRLSHGEVHPMDHFMGYAAAKAGQNRTARDIFEDYVAAEANARAMTWLAWIADNGLAGDADPEAAARWDRRAAEAGDSVGQFNHGLNLLRGHGVAMDEAEGRRFVRQAAAAGNARAGHLIDSDWDLESVTPDADSDRYVPRAW